jgi:XisH protein
MYSRILQKLEPDRQLYLAVNRSISEGLFNEEVGKLLLDEPGLGKGAEIVPNPECMPIG